MRGVEDERGVVLVVLLLISDLGPANWCTHLCSKTLKLQFVVAYDVVFSSFGLKQGVQSWVR